VRSLGNLLQDAVDMGKKDFVRILLEFGADPHANTDWREKTPMEIAVERDNFEVLIILAGFAEVSADMKLDFLGMILENEGDENYSAEFKKNLEGLSVPEVLEKQLKWSWHLKCEAPTSDDQICINMLQFAAARGKTDLLQLLLDHGMDPEAHEGESPTAVELAAVNGQIETFEALRARLEIAPDNDWFQLAQLLVWGMSGDDVCKHRHNWKPSEEFKELLGRIPPAKVSKESVCGSTLLQGFSRAGNTSGVALLLQHGVNPAATTAKNPKLPEHWALEYKHVGVLLELAKVKELEADIMDSSLGMLVRKEEEKEWRRKMLEQCSKAVRQQEEWQKEVVGMLKQQQQLNSLLVNSLLEMKNQPSQP